MWWTVLAALYCWTVLYVVLCRLSLDYETACRTVTAIHAVLVVALASWGCFVQGPWPFSDPGGANTPLQSWTCSVCLAYFIFDLGWCLFFKSEGALMLVHHLLSLVGLLYVLVRGRSGTEMMATIFGTELTNPLLQLRWLLRRAGRHQSRAARCNELAFAALFAVLRLGVGSWLLRCHLRHPAPELFAKVGGVCVYIVSWLFFGAIGAHLCRKYGRRKDGGTADGTRRNDVITVATRVKTE